MGKKGRGCSDLMSLCARPCRKFQHNSRTDELLSIYLIYRLLSVEATILYRPRDSNLFLLESILPHLKCIDKGEGTESLVYCHLRRSSAAMQPAAVGPSEESS